MAMMTAEQYEVSLRRLKLRVYLLGERVDNVVDHPIIRPSMKAVAKTYELAHLPEYEDLLTATSHLSGKRINRFTHIHQSAEDLVRKSKMGRLLGRQTGSCFQRCVGLDALNTLSIVTYDVDQECGTAYYDRFLNYLATEDAQNIYANYGFVRAMKDELVLRPIPSSGQQTKIGSVN